MNLEFVPVNISGPPPHMSKSGAIKNRTAANSETLGKRSEILQFQCSERLGVSKFLTLEKFL